MTSGTTACFYWILILNTFGPLDGSEFEEESKPPSPLPQIPDDEIDPQRSMVRRKIVRYHNFYRTKVRPTASNMLRMTWHPLAAQQAQQYAEKCQLLKNNDPGENSVPEFGSCGQNIFVTNTKTSWNHAIMIWFIEKKNFTYGVPVRNIEAVGQYTQLVWATSHKVGCGLAHCPDGPSGEFWNYVCNYCPRGNLETIIQYPYKIGEPCADCPNDCVSGTLCSSICPHQDTYSNCAELVAVAESVCEQGLCNATCICGKNKNLQALPEELRFCD